jgi:hypothetical protein
MAHTVHYSISPTMTIKHRKVAGRAPVLWQSYILHSYVLHIHIKILFCVLSYYFTVVVALSKK